MTDKIKTEMLKSPRPFDVESGGAVDALKNEFGEKGAKKIITYVEKERKKQ